MFKGQNVTLVIGGQYGSEGKGAVVQEIANRYNVHVRVGSPNAGHTIYYKGNKYTMQMVPCGWVNPKAALIIGRGALINPDILLAEIERIREVDPTITDRLYVDYKAGVLDYKYRQYEGGTGGLIHQRIGSTGEGVGAARIGRIERIRGKDGFQLFEDIMHENKTFFKVACCDTVTLMENLSREGVEILVEGTQGSGLSMIHGPYPYVTSTDTNAGQMLADTGLSPFSVKRILMILRTYPIRVAGNSGPLENEVSWEYLSQILGRRVLEYTTVTRKPRRVGKWDDKLVNSAMLLNKPTALVITFMDYLDPEISEADTIEEIKNNYPTSGAFLEYVERRWGVPIAMVGVGKDESKGVKFAKSENWEELL